jgi:fructose-1-phosphate kinase PfkB-like protein
MKNEDAYVVKTYWHDPLSRINIKNDTGAGDAFAGGFIAGMLSHQMLPHQPAPIRLGATAAAARLSTRNEPYSAITKATNSFLHRLDTNETVNWRQHVGRFFTRWFPWAWAIIASIIAGIILTCF